MLLPSHSYWLKATEFLSHDSVMQCLVNQFQGSIVQSRGDAFYTLVRSVIGQQISVRAADAVWGRLGALLPELHPDAVLALEEIQLKSCGLSRQKIAYLRNVSVFFIAHGITTPDYWNDMDDSAVIGHLTQIKGIGRWSAEMFLIFCLMRPDVFPIDDIGLQRALCLHYGLLQKPFPMHHALLLADSWRPYRSVATWYLWRSIDPAEVGY